MSVLNIAVLLTLIGLGMVAYGVNRNSVSSLNSSPENLLVNDESLEVSPSIIGNSDYSPNEEPDQSNGISDDELSRSILVLEQDLTKKKIEYIDVADEKRALSNDVGNLILQKKALKNDLSKLMLEITDIKNQVEADLKTGSKEDSEISQEVLNQKARLTQENKKLLANISQKDGKIKSLEDEILDLNSNKIVNQAENEIEETNIRVENLTLELESLRKEIENNKVKQKDFDKLVESQKQKIVQVKARNNKLEKKLQEKTANSIDFSSYNGMIASFTGYLLYEPKKKEIILVTPENIKFTILQDDFPGDLVAKCGLPVSESSTDRCIATILAEIIIDDGQLVLRGKGIKEITKK